MAFLLALVLHVWSKNNVTSKNEHLCQLVVVGGEAACVTFDVKNIDNLNAFPR